MSQLSPTRVILVFLLIAGALCAQERKKGWEKLSTDVQVFRHEDGTDTEYHRFDEGKTLKKVRVSNTKGGRNSVLTRTLYRMDDLGNPLSCKIYDGKGNELFKVAYGYHRESGRLVAEDMFDARVPKKDPKTGKELPIRRIYWRYDGSGNAHRPISFVFREGAYAEEQFGRDQKAPSTFPSDNPFQTEAARKAAPAASEEFEVPPLPPLPFEN